MTMAETINSEIVRLLAKAETAEQFARICWLESVSLGQVRITTHYDPTPIPVRMFDWRATEDGYEPGCPIGWGATEAEAIAELQEDIENSAGIPREIT